MPANQKNLHWSLFVYEKDTKTLHHYDSLGGLNFAYFSPLCEEILRNITPGLFSIKQEITPQQPNGNDCGVYVMAISQFLIKKYKRNTLEMSWKINDGEVAEIHQSVREIRKKI